MRIVTVLGWSAMIMAAEPAAEVASDMAALRQRLAAVEARVAVLEAAGTRGEIPRLTNDKFPKVNPAYLKTIVLPPTPTHEQVVVYIEALKQACGGIRNYNDDDPQTEMLQRVGPEHVATLLDALEGSMEVNFYIVKAVIRLAEDRHKEDILKRLGQHRGLIEVVRNKGWERDAKATLERGLEEEEYLPQAWLTCAVRLKDPHLDDLALEFLVRGNNKESTYEAVKSLPQERLDPAVAKAWESVGRRTYERKGFAPVALRHGVRDALRECLVLLANPTTGDYYRGRIESALESATIQGAGAEWTPAQVTQTPSAITWDPALRQWRGPQAGAAGAGTAGGF